VSYWTAEGADAAHLEICHQKAIAVIGAETAEVLEGVLVLREKVFPVGDACFTTSGIFSITPGS